MDTNEHFSMKIFTDTTKKTCTCSALSIFLIVLFIVSPLSNLFFISFFMKILILILLLYTIYLNIQQTNYLRRANQMKVSREVNNQLNINIICSYIFTLFIGLLIIFVIKSIF
jgi:hypothetical protein